MKNNLKKQTRFGESKHQAKAEARKIARENNEPFKQVKGIYSFNTLKSYDKSGKQFINYCITNHSEIKSISDCKAFVGEYLQKMQDEHNLSAWSLHMYGSALASIYDCDKKDFGFDFPKRERANITRSRSESASHVRVSDMRFDRIKEFCIATGARRICLLRICKDTDLRERQSGGLEIRLRGKNGMERWARVLPDKENLVQEIFKTSAGYKANDGTIRLFHKRDIPSSLPVHQYRAEYCKHMYKFYESQGFASGEIYYCRKDRAGDSFDKGIMQKVSLEMGHHRTGILLSYLR